MYFKIVIDTLQKNVVVKAFRRYSLFKKDCIFKYVYFKVEKSSGNGISKGNKNLVLVLPRSIFL